MKTLRIIIMVAALALSLSSCDFFRSLVGKPTSAELEKMKIEAQAKARRDKFVADSIKAAQEAAREAAPVEEELPQVEDDDPRYHIIIGCFKVQDNANNLREVLTRNGLNPKRIIFKNGYDAVSIIQSDDWSQIYNQLKDFRNSPYCPEDVWIYDMNEQLHE